MYNFKVIHIDSSSRARRGSINTSSGVVDTPAFMPVGTQATVKSLTPGELEELGYRMIIVNAYHLYLRPGHNIIREMGGLKNFMGWSGSIATDSGGFQVLSLSKKRKIVEGGIVFQSHLDGSEHMLTPAKAMEIQEYLGSDLMMCLDECPPHDSSYENMESAVINTTRWALECKKSKNQSSGALFGIVQGGVHKDLRQRSASELMEIGFDGYSIGGLGIGELTEDTKETTEFCTGILPEDKVRYLMGIGRPVDIVEAVLLGVDLFDCVIPTRNARNGTIFTNKGKIVIKNAQYSHDKLPLDEECGCYTCLNFSRSYLRHLLMAGELLAYRLLTLHNLHYYANLMEKIRKSIESNSLNELMAELAETEAE